MHKTVNRVARFIMRPFFVHILIDPRQCAQHLTPTCIKPDVCANRVHHIDARSFLKLPWPRFERIWFTR